MIWPMSVCNVLGTADVKAKVNTCASLEGALVCLSLHFSLDITHFKGLCHLQIDH